MKVGTCGFSKGMQKHFSSLDSVEIQQTFYRIIREKTLRKWREKAPESFEFTIKAFQGVTHPASSPTWRRANIQVLKGEEVGLLRPTSSVFKFWEITLDEAKILGAKVIVIQLPKSFKDSEESWENAEEFFSKIDRGDFEIAVELRGWKPERAEDFCRKFEVIMCVDPLVCPLAYSPSGLGYFRLHGRYESGRIVYRHKYSDEELRKILHNVLSNNFEENYVMFNNVWMFEDALRFKEMLRGI